MKQQITRTERGGKGPSMYDVTLGEVAQKLDDSTDRLRDWDSDRGRGVHNLENLRDIVHGWP